MPSWLKRLPQWLFASDLTSSPGTPGRLVPRWLFLRALGLIYFSAFYSLVRQVNGLIGPDGLQPVGAYLEEVKQIAGASRYWYAPTVFWLADGSRALLFLCWLGIVASLLLTLNFWPRAMLVVCLVVFLSFIATLQIFASYQSDGMLLGAGFVSVFFAPPGLRPGWGERHPPSRASLFLLQWLWFRIYFESGVAKIASGDPEWRHLTAMDEYYQNGPLPTWIGWYAQHLPHWFHVGTAGLTLGLELVLVWMLFLPRPFRIVLFAIVTPLQLGIIATSNYAFLNYLVLVLGFLLLDDKLLRRFFLPKRLREPQAMGVPAAPVTNDVDSPDTAQEPGWHALVARRVAMAGLVFAAICLSWNFYATTVGLLQMILPAVPLPMAPVVALEPSRIAESYGLFAVMTRARYEIEFQGSNDGQSWTAYPFRYKPQDPRQPPGIYAPYQPRFDWNLWFASLSNWQENRFVIDTEERLLTNSPAVLALFAGNPFQGSPPRQVRAVIWQYWFTERAEKRLGFWWRRQFLGSYAPTLVREDDGRFAVIGAPEAGLTNER
jgi:lipase maturation factor 1